MSDALADALAPIIERHAYDAEYGDCNCGWPDPPEVVKDSGQWSDHVAPLVAAAARAHIADELHAFGEQHSIGAYGTYGPPAIALSDAESIARGDTE